MLEKICFSWLREVFLYEIVTLRALKGLGVEFALNLDSFSVYSDLL